MWKTRQVFSVISNVFTLGFNSVSFLKYNIITKKIFWISKCVEKTLQKKHYKKGSRKTIGNFSVNNYTIIAISVSNFFFTWNNPSVCHIDLCVCLFLIIYFNAQIVSLESTELKFFLYFFLFFLASALGMHDAKTSYLPM